MAESRKTIAEVESGKIELVFNERQLTMQFNSSCIDALPYCKASCCRYRPFYNLALEDDEKDKFEKTIMHPADPKVRLLDHKNGNCAYLDSGACLCSVHEDKPKICGKWHCSPGGVGEGIEIRDDGWVLLPTKGDAQHTEVYGDEHQDIRPPEDGDDGDRNNTVH